MNPRPYQLNCVAAVEKAFEEFDKQLIVVPTGGGKTCIFSWLAERRQAKGERTLILAHRDELIDQAIAKLKTATGICAQKEKAEFEASLTAPVVVASIQTMLRRLAKWPVDHFGLVVADEAHHALSDSWQNVLRHFKAQVLGVTATPDRGDKKNLGNYFQTIGFEISLFDLIDANYLSRITLKSIPLQIDLGAIKSTAGDFDDSDLAKALDPYLDEIADAIRIHATTESPFGKIRRRTLAFLPLIATSQKFVAACRNAGLLAEHIDGKSPNRKELLESFAASEFDVLSNPMLLSEGFDDPGIDCVCVLRPTRSRPLYCQMVGRGTRIADCKENLLLLDFLWMHERHNIIRPAHLIAKSQEEAEQITEMAMAGAAMPADIADQMPLDLQGLASEAQVKREEALRKRLEAQKDKKAKTVSAEQFAIEHNSLAVAEYQETMPWEVEKMTPKQETVLKRVHIDLSTVRGKGHASKLISLHFATKPLTLASPAQRDKMRRMGFPNAGNATTEDARRFFRDLRKPRQESLFV